MSKKADDVEYEEYDIVSVEPLRDGPKMWRATLQYGYTVTLPRGGGAKQPKDGMTVKIYGDIEDGDIRGVDLDGTQVFYRTAEQQHEWLKEQEKEATRAGMADYAIRKHEYEHRLEQIPPELRARIDHLRKKAPDVDTFNALYLESEIVVSEHAWWLSQLIYTPIDLGIFKSLPKTSKMSSVYAQMCDDIRERLKNAKGSDEEADLRSKCDIIDETVFVVDIAPDWLDRIFDLALSLIGDEDRALPGSPGPRSIASSEDMLS